MNQAIAKADTLIEAMGWIRRFRGKTTVIKLGGSLLEDRTAMHHLLLDVIFMETVGLRPVVVHGGGKAITQAMADAGIVAQFIRGRRVTDEPSLKVVEQVLAGELNVELTEMMERLGGRAMNLSPRTTCVLHGQKMLDPDGEDLGFVGEVTRVDRDVIESLAYTDQVPVIPSLCYDDEGQLYNVNADTAAMAVAQSLGADKLVFLSDVNGVRRDESDPNSIIPAMSAATSRELIASGVIRGGMIPKVEACLETLDRGVQKVHIIDGRLRHSLLLEIFTTDGVGTEIHA
ncbi:MULTISPECIES: acetylglutamate kinase [Pirellulaceae]|uniref:Acetylglutamate kinase n=1 Tax=Aporhodopirellula rubra TaxID=980271 RepID=A0A7W5E2I5_9BACT|nr:MULTISPECIES: acetylglutamate kinase [Pirellulaceae]EMI42146.1 acetylglutamate kinase [Rhodopirellula sp. SWK7]MBB3209015.1 acetylglutamate kinase [Aporhodopirellula rubra]